MDPDTINSIRSSLDCLLESNDRMGLILDEMLIQNHVESARSIGIITVGVITVLGLLVVKALWSLRLNHSARVAGTIATVALIGILSVKVPDWPTASMMNELAELKSDAGHQRTDTRCVEARRDDEL